MMDFHVGTMEDVNRMVSSEAPEGSFLFRPTENTPNCITLCVKESTQYKKYRIIEVKEGNNTTYMWINKDMQGNDGPKEKFPTLNNLVERKQHVFHLKSNFLAGQNLDDDEIWGMAGEDTYNDPLDYNTGIVVPFDGVGDLKAQLSKIKFYVGYMGGKDCNIALSNDPPGI